MKEYQEKSYIPPEQRKNILLLSDDLRMNSGIATMSRNIVMGTAHHYNWVQLGAAVKHPDIGKAFDLSKEMATATGVPDAKVILYPSEGYGTPDAIRRLLMSHKIDGILHFTDPRFWTWLYDIEHEIREHVPLMFYHIWDDLPYPQYNRDFYESCDWIGCISRQTENLVRQVWGRTDRDSWQPFEDWQVKYIPHGINKREYFPIDQIAESDRLNQTKQTLFKGKNYDFVLFWNNRNIRRKLPGDVILAFKTFCDGLTKEQASKCVLLMHTMSVDENGTNLRAVRNEICPDYDVIFTDRRVASDELNRYYNISDVTLNIASNEGWGLSSTESMMAGTMVINNSTGGLVDQCRFVDKKGNPIKYTKEWGTNSDGRYKNCGDWCIPVFPATRSLVGSVPTPYIFDDRCKWEDVAKAMKTVYDIPKNERADRGSKGREYALSDQGMMTQMHMSMGFIDGIDTTFKNFKKRQRYNLFAA